MGDNIKSKLALAAAAVLAIAVAACAGALIWFHMRAATADPDPDGAAGSFSLELPDGSLFEGDGVDWGYWLEVNPDIVAWVTVPGTKVDFPVVRAPADDPDYYLKHDVYGGANPMGTVYLDAECEGIGEGGNSVIFGHHYGDEVFADMAGYSDPEWARTHRFIILRTPDGTTRVLSVQAADVIPGSAAVKRTDFSGEADLMAYWAERFYKSDVRLADAPAETRQIYTFVTCSYTRWVANERTLTYAVELFST